jgi:hypothetical protein
MLTSVDFQTVISRPGFSSGSGNFVFDAFSFRWSSTRKREIDEVGRAIDKQAGKQEASDRSLPWIRATDDLLAQTTDLC